MVGSNICRDHAADRGMAGRDPMTVSFRMILAIVLAIVITAPALVSAENISIVDDFPASQNGEHTISLEYRAGGVYDLLAKVSPAQFAYPEPKTAADDARRPIISLGEHGVNDTWVNATRCYVLPAAVNVSGIDADGVIRVSLPTDAGEIAVSGSAGIQSGDVVFRIYCGEGSYERPLWSSSAGGSFHLSVPDRNNAELFFVVQAKGDDIRDVAYWENVRVTYTPAPAPTTPTPTQTPVPTKTPVTTQTPDNATTIPESIAPSPTVTVHPTSSPMSQDASSDLPWAAIGVVLAAVISSITSIYVARSKR
jgi:hypothetical protein